MNAHFLKLGGQYVLFFLTSFMLVGLLRWTVHFLCPWISSPLSDCLGYGGVMEEQAELLPPLSHPKNTICCLRFSLFFHVFWFHCWSNPKEHTMLIIWLKGFYYVWCWHELQSLLIQNFCVNIKKLYFMCSIAAFLRTPLPSSPSTAQPPSLLPSFPFNLILQPQNFNALYNHRLNPSLSMTFDK